MAESTFRRQIPKRGAECANRACSDLTGGRAAMPVPTGLKQFLRDRIPARFGIGSGQIIGPNSPDSRQSDIIFYDTNICAPIVADEHSQLYPADGVSGILEVKSQLSKTELIDGLGKVSDFKRLVPRDNVSARFGMMESTRPREQPFGVIFAYSLAGNSLASLEANMREYEASLDDRSLATNIVVVLNEGLILHKNRQNLDNIVLTDALTEQPNFALALAHGRATLFEFYTILLDMLINTQLDLVNLEEYRQPVERLGSHIVRNHDRLFRRGDSRRFRLTSDFIATVVAWCAGQQRLSSNELNRLILPEAPGITERFAADGPPVIYLYNPESLPRVTMDMIASSVDGRVKEPCLIGTFFIDIDSEQYAIPAFYTEGNTEEIPGASATDSF